MIPKLSEPALIGLTCAAVLIVYGALWLAGHGINAFWIWRVERRARRRGRLYCFMCEDAAEPCAECARLMIEQKHAPESWVRWETVMDPRTAHLAALALPSSWDEAEPPPLDLGRFGCAVRYVMPGESFQLPEFRITLPEAGSGQLAAPAAPESSLPDGLIERDGEILFECRICGEWKSWPADPADFDIDHPHNVCGGSPRCCP